MLRSLALASSCAALITGCALAHGPVVAPVTLDMKGPVSAGPAMTASKTGRAEAWGIVHDDRLRRVAVLTASLGAEWARGSRDTPQPFRAERRLAAPAKFWLV